MKVRLIRAVFVTILLVVSGRPASSQAATATLTVAPAKLDFGSRPVNSSSPPQAVTLTNTGNSPLTISALLTSGIDFSQINDCGPTINAGASCTVQVIFKPATTGDRLGTLNILAVAPATPQMLAISGVGE